MATWTEPINWTARQIVTESDMDAQVSENMRFLHERGVGAFGRRLIVDELGADGWPDRGGERVTFTSSSDAWISLGGDWDFTADTYGGTLMVACAAYAHTLEGSQYEEGLGLRLDSAPTKAIWKRGRDGNRGTLVTSVVFIPAVAGNHRFRVMYRRQQTPSEPYSSTLLYLLTVDIVELPMAMVEVDI